MRKILILGLLVLATLPASARKEPSPRAAVARQKWMCINKVQAWTVNHPVCPAGAQVVEI
jgi:hypothetical protein